MKISMDSIVKVDAEYVKKNNGLYRIYDKRGHLVNAFLFTIREIVFYISPGDSLSPWVHDNSYLRGDYLFEKVNGTLSFD